MEPGSCEDTSAVVFPIDSCVNCGVSFLISPEVDSNNPVDKFIDFPAGRKIISNFDALRTVFKANFRLNQHFGNGAETEAVIPLCKKCTQCLGNLHQSYTQFISYASKESPLRDLMRRTLTWIDKFPELGLGYGRTTSEQSQFHIDIEQPSLLHFIKREPVEDVKILPDLSGFDDNEDYADDQTFAPDMNGSDSDDDWAWPTSRKRKRDDLNYKSKAKVVKMDCEIPSTVTRSKTLGLKNVTVSIEPLHLEELVSKEPEPQPGADPPESLASRKTYLINKQQLRKTRQLLLCRKKREKRKIKLKNKPCTVCGKVFKDNDGLRRHAVVHTDERKFKCTQCQASYKVKRDLNRHMNYKHAVGGVLPGRTCEICELYFPLPSILRDHVKNVHSPDRPFCCELCGKRFGTKNYLNIHKKMQHEYSKSHKCDYCEKILSSKSGLRTHIATVHENERNFACDQCPKKFYLEKYLTQHKLTHLEKEKRERRFVCQHCNAKFMCSNSLKVHVAKHKMAHDKLCADCGAAFKNKSSLQRHIESRHTEGEGFRCGLCDKVFKVKEYLMQHMRSKTHGGLGHYAERLKNGTTTRVVPKIVPLLEPGSDVVLPPAPTVPRAPSGRRKRAPKSQSLNTYTTPGQFPSSLLEPPEQQQQIMASDVQYIFAPLPLRPNT